MDSFNPTAVEVLDLKLERCFQQQVKINESVLARLEKAERRIQKIVDAFPYNFNQESFWRD